MAKKNFTWFIVLLISLFIFIGCNDNSSRGDKTQNSQSQISFDTSNKLVSANGNIVVAVNKIHNMDINSVWNNSKSITAEALTKSPYSAIGNLYKIIGKVYKAEELPPGESKGHWSEILLLTDNPNSPLGVTTIDFIYNGSILSIKSGQILTCAGFFVGTFESENAMGGKVEAVTFVGNNARLK